jgi:hypothetical protein
MAFVKRPTAVPDGDSPYYPGPLERGTTSPELVGDDDGLRPVAQPQLAQHAADVRLDRFLGDDEMFCYLRVG